MRLGNLKKYKTIEERQSLIKTYSCISCKVKLQESTGCYATKSGHVCEDCYYERMDKIELNPIGILRMHK